MTKKTDRTSGKHTNDDFEHISMWQAKKGDLVCYPKSNTIYHVADKTEDYVLIVSSTQSYKLKRTTDLKRVMRADEVNEDSYSRLLERLSSDKNVPLDELLKISASHMSARKSQPLTTPSAVSRSTILEPAREPMEYTYQLPDDWNADGWFDKMQDRVYRTEKEVETKFILPLLTRLEYSEDDRHDGMLIGGAEGSRKISLEVDFAMSISDEDSIKEQIVLVVEAKKSIAWHGRPRLRKLRGRHGVMHSGQGANSDW